LACRDHGHADAGPLGRAARRGAQGPGSVVRGARDLHDRTAGGRRRARVPRLHRAAVRAEALRVQRLRPGPARATPVLTRAKKKTGPPMAAPSSVRLPHELTHAADGSGVAPPAATHSARRARAAPRVRETTGRHATEPSRLRSGASDCAVSRKITFRTCR